MAQPRAFGLPDQTSWISDCPADAPCQAILQDAGRQVQGVFARFSEQNRTVKQLEERYEKLTQEYVHLNQQHHIITEHCQKGDASHRSLEIALQNSETKASLGHQVRRHLQDLLNHERKVAQQADARLDHTLETTRMLAQCFHVACVNQSDLSEEQKKMLGQLDYAGVYIERNSLRHECEQLRGALAKERARSVGPGSMQLKQPW